MMDTQTSKNTPSTRSHKMALRPQNQQQATSRAIPPFSSFTCFMKLPLKLRVMIWKLAEPERILLLTPPDDKKHIGHVNHLSGPTRILNEVSTESRTQTESNYRQISITSRLGCPHCITSAETRPHVVFNPQLDIIYARDWGTIHHEFYFLDLLETKEGERIKKFAFHETMLGLPLQNVYNIEKRTIAAFMNLDELIIVLDNTNKPTRTKILRPGIDVDLEKGTVRGLVSEWQGSYCMSGWWGRGKMSDLSYRWNQVGNWVVRLKEAEKNDKKAKMPIVKVMVVNQKDFKPPKRTKYLH